MTWRKVLLQLAFLASVLIAIYMSLVAVGLAAMSSASANIDGRPAPFPGVSVLLGVGALVIFWSLWFIRSRQRRNSKTPVARFDSS